MIVRKNLKNHREESHEEVDSEGTWAVSYGDMVTLLLSFFILFFSLDPEKAKGKVGGESGEITSKNKVSIQSNQKLRFHLVEALQKNSNSILGDSKEMKNNINSSASESSIDREAYPNSISEDLAEKWGGIIYNKENYIIVDFPGISFFKSGGVDITDSGKLHLEKFVNIFMPYMGSYHLSIRAYTDPRPVKIGNEFLVNRKYKDNLELSALRAISALRVMQKNGIPLKKMKIAGYGELKSTIQEIYEIEKKKKKSLSQEIEKEFSLQRKIILVIEPEVL